MCSVPVATEHWLGDALLQGWTINFCSGPLWEGSI